MTWLPPAIAPIVLFFTLPTWLWGTTRPQL